MDMLSYLGGLFDGEGNAGVTLIKRKFYPNAKKQRRSETLVPYLQLKMTDFQSVRLYYNMFGGSYGEYARTGEFSHCKPIAVWRVSHQKALKAAQTLLPYSILKHDQLTKVINHYCGGK